MIPNDWQQGSVPGDYRRGEMRGAVSMRNNLIAVDDKLENVRQFLTDRGYHVVPLDPDISSVAAVVVSGMDEDYLGVQSMSTVAPVIDARGKAPEEILSDIEERLQIRG